MLYSSVLICSFFLAAVVNANNTPPQLNVVPYPSDVVLGSGSARLDSTFKMHVTQCTVDCDIIDRAIERYMDVIFKPLGSTSTVFRQNIFENRVNATIPTDSSGFLTQLTIATSATDSAELQLGVDESYVLEVPSGQANDQTVTLAASTTWGILRGLETFAQLVQYKSTPPSFTKKGVTSNLDGYTIDWIPMIVTDSPRYYWRGLLVDSARHFLTIPLLQRIIDTMAALKMNVLHWHMVDAESFPFVSEKYPELQRASTYHPKASYMKEDIKDLIAYARDRGVRIMPEFDTPGHTASIGQTYPEMIADCYDWLVDHYGDDLRWPMFNDVALDVTREETKTFAREIIAEMSEIFPDDFFHIGGDEVNQVRFFVVCKKYFLQIVLLLFVQNRNSILSKSVLFVCMYVGTLERRPKHIDVDAR